MSDSSSDTSFLVPDDAVTIKRWIIEEVVDGLLYGVEVLLTMSVCIILYRQGLSNSLARRLLFIATLSMFLGSSITVIARTVYYVVQIQQLGDSSYNPLPTMTAWNIAHVVASKIIYFLGDLIVVWRAWILYESRIIKSFLSACVLLSLATSILNVVISVRDVQANGFTAIRFLLPASLIFTNLVATILIGYKAWVYRHFIKSHLGTFNTRTQVEQVLILLVESGLVYCAIWVLDLVLVSILSTANSASEYLAVLFPHLETIYPNTIILLTALQKTHCETTLQGRVSISQPIHFATVLGTSTSTPGVHTTQVGQMQSVRFQRHVSGDIGTIGEEFGESEGNTEGSGEVIDITGEKKEHSMKRGEFEMV
ncbi:hypothetical protein K435DRAFT_756123 [Dendrothele bispora CBS 962.96]|uniref:Uncharacterized protein n=1 Tax=Dendrothele bispora (strain CBS 962.96) TaxID=1314807 RepID=A0A4S8LZ93_DENBC|nr:hypothetical protein K435DRAFT_756123 [Dendrothele bispora CBS 962.96]